MAQIDPKTGKFTTENGQEVTQDKYTPEYLESFRVDPVNIPEKPPEVIRMNNNTLLSEGNFSILIGKAKAKKSMLCSILANCVINPVDTLTSTDEYFCGIRSDDRYEILYMDTEQSNYHAALNANRIYKLSGKPDNINYLAIRELDTLERFEHIEEFIKYYSKCRLVIIDGIRDLSTGGINDEECATKITDLLLRLSSRYNIHIICILHVNKNDNNARGHLGTELINKGEATLKIEKDEKQKHISNITPEFTRNIEPEPLALCVNNEGIPEVIPYMENQKEAKGVLPQNYEIEQHKKVIDGIFETQEKYGSVELISKIQFFVAKVIGVEIGQTKARHFIDYYQDKGFILKEGDSQKSKFVRLFL